MPRRKRPKAPTFDYADPEGNVLTLRGSLSPASIRKIAARSDRAGASADDAWRRREEMIFERVAVRWEIAGLPLEDQAMLLGRYRMADAATREWVRRTVASHVDEHIPGLRDQAP